MTKNIFFIFNVKVWLLKNIVILLTLGKSKNIVILLTLGKSKILSFCRLWVGHPLSQHSQLCSPWLPTPNCAALTWLTGCHAMPGVTKCFPSSPYTSPFPTQLVRLPLFTYPYRSTFPTRPNLTRPDLTCPTRPNPPNPTCPAPACFIMVLHMIIILKLKI